MTTRDGGGNEFNMQNSTFSNSAFGTNTVYTGNPTSPDPRSATATPPSDRAQRRRQVFVVHGRDNQARQAVFEFLRDLDLLPLDWEAIVATTGKPAPHVLEVVEQGFAEASAVLVLLTPDDFAFLHETLREDSDLPYELKPSGQPRPNVLFEAGMAFALHRDRTLLVEIGPTRPFSDVGGIDFVKIDGSVDKLRNIVSRLGFCFMVARLDA